jgi:hypothetical protein
MQLIKTSAGSPPRLLDDILDASKMEEGKLEPDAVARLRFCVSDTGIGLAVASQLVGLMGGDIRVDSEPGRGTDFHFTLRLALAARAPARSGCDAGRAGPAGRRERRRMARMLRPYDSPGRYGGEELMAVLPACDGAAALEVAERIRQAVYGEPVATDFGALPVSVGIGVAVLAGGAGAALNQLIQCADQALYATKNGGRNRGVLAA